MAALAGDGTDMEGYESTIHIRHNDKNKLLVQEGSSLMKVLSEQALFMARLYVILEGSNKGKRPAIIAKIREDLPRYPLK